MIKEKIKEFEQLSKEARLEKLEFRKEEQEQELKAIEISIEKTKDLFDILPSDSQAKDEAKKFFNKLINEKDFQEEQLKEIEASIDYVKSESKGIKSIFTTNQ
jgi:hypothetical protein